VGEPVPLGVGVSTAGAEDSPFIVPDGRELYFFFTPDVDVPPEEQLVDGVTGIWQTERVDGRWADPRRLDLGSGPSLDGAVVVSDDTMWFASVRAGNYTEVDVYTAERVDGRWPNATNAGEQLNRAFDVGEFHVVPDGSTIFFDREGDLYQSHQSGASWRTPERLGVSSRTYSESQPFVTPAGDQLWFTGASRNGYPGPAVFRSTWTASDWGAPEEAVSDFAGDPCLDEAGSLYFLHHYFEEDRTMLEADIYVSRRGDPSPSRGRCSIVSLERCAHGVQVAVPLGLR
jgi:hypothetical protein